MDLSLFSYKSRLKNILWLFMITSLLSSYVSSWRITQKCPHGHYFNDGCTACWCDTRTGHTKCEKLSRCSGIQTEQDKCPLGRQFKDNCGNDCTCYESTGAVFCNEKRRCPQEIIRNVVPIQIQTRTSILTINEDGFMKRGGPTRLNTNRWTKDEESTRYRQSTSPPSRTTTSPPQRRYSTSYTTRSPGTSRRPSIFDGLTVSSTPLPHLRIPSTRSRSEELIIEPAIIIRTKGSNKANIVRSPSSATSVTLSSKNRSPSGGSVFLGGKRNRGKYSNPYSSDKRLYSSKPNALTPLLLYEKQLKAIMDIKKAYAKILGSKVNFNFQLATGQVGNPTVTLQQQVQQEKTPAQNNGLLFIQNKMDNGLSSTTEHPRRFDENYENSTYLFDTSSSTPSPVQTTSQQPRPLLSMNTPFFWHKEHIKNTLKQFSPVPPLQQLVSYVTSSTENYLSQFLSNLGNKNKQIQISPETTTMTPVPPPPPPPPPASFLPSAQSFPPFTSNLPSPPPGQYQPYPTLLPSQEPLHDPSTVPVNQVYQNYQLKPLLSIPTQPSQVSPPYLNYHSNSNLYHSTPHFDNNHVDQFSQRRTDSMLKFPFVNELMQEIARIDQVPTATPRTSPALTALPTFQTPGPPYAEVDVVQPLSFLPPPKPEPATPTRRIFNVGRNPPQNQLNFMNRPRPTVHVNLDKPIYVPSPHQNKPHQRQDPPRHPPPPLLHNHYFHPPNHFLPPPYQPHRRIFARPLPPHPTHPPQLHYAPPPPRFNPQPQFFMPKPKQYRLVLKGPMREAAVRMDDVVPNFVQKIAHEFFKKPEIYVPKIRPGKPLTLEKVVLNHKEIVPQEVMFSPTTPGSVQLPMTKLRFTPEAQWQMKEDLAKHGIMVNEPLPNPIRDYALKDPNVMEMDAPIESVQTWETHTGMEMGQMPDVGFSGAPGGGMLTDSSSILQTQPIQQTYQQPAPPPPQEFFPQHFPTSQSPNLQLQQELQRQILMAQHNQNPQMISSPVLHNSNKFSVDPGDFNDFGHAQQDQQQQQHPYPPELNIPGVQQVIVDKFIVHDPMDPLQPIKMFSTTTVQPPTRNLDNRVDLSAVLANPHRTGLPQLSGQEPTQSPSVLIRHHGAPSSTTAQPTQTPSPVLPTFSGSPSLPTDNILVTVINSTPQPQIVTTTISPLIVDFPSSFQLQNPPTIGIPPPVQQESLAGQIHDFLKEQMDFGARPQMELFDVLLNSGTAAPETLADMMPPPNYKKNFEGDAPDQMAAESRSGEEHQEVPPNKTIVADTDDTDVETDKLASIFSMDYKSKYDRKPPEVIVIKVPPDHSDGPFPKVVEKRKGAELEIQGRPVKLSNKNGNIETSTENSIHTSTSRSSGESGASDENESKEPPTTKRTSEKRRKKKRRKKNRNRDKDNENDKNDEDGVKMRPTELTPNDNDQKEDESAKQNEESNPDKEASAKDAEQKFNQELDWKSQLMANICELNPSSPLCLTYRSICLLMTSDD